MNGLAAFIRAELDPDAGPILYLSGAETAGDLEAQLKTCGFDCRRVVLYDAAPAATLGEIAAALDARALDAVLLYSPRSAKIWRGLVEAAGLATKAAPVSHLCLSRNVAAVLPEGWNVAVSASPDEAAILELLEQSGRTL